MSAAGEIGRYIADQLRLLDRRLMTGEWLCCCGPAYRIDGELWAYNTADGWHDPGTEHAALWPVGGGV